MSWCQCTLLHTHAAAFCSHAFTWLAVRFRGFYGTKSWVCWSVWALRLQGKRWLQWGGCHFSWRKPPNLLVFQWTPRGKIVKAPLALAQELNFDWDLSAKGTIWLIEDGMNATAMTSALFSTTLADLQVRDRIWQDDCRENDFQARVLSRNRETSWEIQKTTEKERERERERE